MTTRKNHVSISVCIPCTFEHIFYLDDCLKSIERQTFQPLEVVISLSSINSDDATRIKKQMVHYDLDVKIFHTSKRKYAGENRNKAVSHARGDIVSFIDADDLMRSDRLFTLSKIFEEHPDCLGVLHHFKENVFEKKCLKEHANESHPYAFSKKLHFGHGSFKRVLFEEYQYTSKPRGQDVEFVHNVIQQHLDRLRVCPLPLTFYHSNRSTFF